MGNIVFAAPTIQRYHLHDVLARQLLRRGHRVTVLAADPVTQQFYTAQGMRSTLLPQQTATSELRGMPLGATALRDCRLRGLSRPTGGQLQRARARLSRFVPGLLRFFGVEGPEVVFIHGQRGGLHRMIDFIAHEFGCEVLHTGDGALPGTMQWDPHGIDGDAALCRRESEVYRRGARDPGFVMAALAAVLGGSTADPLERRALAVPTLPARVRGVIRALTRRQVGPALYGLSAWRRGMEARGVPHERNAKPLPDGPFVTVLLQAPSAPAMRLDAIDAPSHAQLILATQAAVFSVDSALPIVIVPPPQGVAPEVYSVLHDRAKISECRSEDAMNAIATALAVVTVNHAHGLAAILAGTPLVHTGDAIYGHAALATRSTLDSLRHDLAGALQRPAPPYRESYLTHTLAYDHVWCDPDAPDENGLSGLVQNLEERMNRTKPTNHRIAYRAGPAWMATEDGPSTS